MVGTDIIGGDRLTPKKIEEPGGWVGRSVGQKRFYNPLWLFRAQLGFRIQVRAECGNKEKEHKMDREVDGVGMGGYKPKYNNSKKPNKTPQQRGLGWGHPPPQ